MTPLRSGTITIPPATTGAPAGGAALVTAHCTVSGRRWAPAGPARVTEVTRTRTRQVVIRAIHLQDIVVRRESTPYNSAVPFTRRVTPDHRRTRFRIAVYPADCPE